MSSCGSPVAEGDKTCSKCGTDLRKDRESVHELFALETPPEEHYTREFSVFQRLLKVLISPSSAMKDIALAPEYGDVIAIIIFNVILSGIAILLVLQKIHYTGGGQYMAYFWSIFMGVLAFAVLLAGVVFVVFWLVKSFLVKYFCDSGSEWGFRTVAAVTGYAYLPDIVIALIGAFAAWFLFPQMTFNLSDMEAAMRALADYQAQMSWIKLFLTLPLSVIGLFRKSYLGGLGARYGTKGKCTLGMGLPCS